MRVVVTVELAPTGPSGLCSMLLRELDLGPDAQPSEIRGQFRRLAKETHPDIGGDPEQFRKVHAAYSTLVEMGRV